MYKKITFNLVFFVSILSASGLLAIKPSNSEIKQIVDEALKHLKDHSEYAFVKADNAVCRANEALGLVHSSNGTALKAFENATEVLAVVGRASVAAKEAVAGIERTQAATANLEQEYKRLSGTLAEEVAKAEERIADTAKRERKLGLEDKIQIGQAKIGEKQRRGIYEQAERIRAQAPIEAEKVKWKNIREIIGDSRPIIKIVLATIAVALCIYSIKYGMPVLTNYFMQPYVVSETSRTGFFGYFKAQQNIDIKDLIFGPSLFKQLSDVLSRVQTARIYDEALPNLLFYGDSGTGKTAFAKALAYASGLDYALTSGSEFAKITDLKIANNELRKLLNWAKKTDKGLLVFIDEAESLFANRKLPTTSKSVQDFINTFLALIPDKAQKNLMFIFATNHPFKLDDAIIDRVGVSIEFTLPDAPERERILVRYLENFAQENKEALVGICPEVVEKLARYAESLKGLAPRAIKFIAQEMVACARRQENKQLTDDIALAAIDQAKHSLEQILQWKKERDEWVGALK
ncbi:MAG: AAA family ATPase [bacterium]